MTTRISWRRWGVIVCLALGTIAAQAEALKVKILTNAKTERVLFVGNS